MERSEESKEQKFKEKIFALQEKHEKAGWNFFSSKFGLNLSVSFLFSLKYIAFGKLD